MSISSWLNSPFYSYNSVANKFDIESVSGNSDPCLPTQDPFLSSHNTDHSGHIFNLFDSYDSETPAIPSNPLMRTFCNSSSATNSQSCNRLPGTVMAVQRNHKVIERQRRKEMKMLFSRLRSLLPEKDTQGKRTVSEQVFESLNYVRHLQQKIRELSAQREKMKVHSDRNAKVSFEKFCNKIPLLDREYPELKINSVGSGVQIWTNTLERDIVYSDILLALEEGGLEVVSAASSAINNRAYHTIHAKVFDVTSFNINTLYQKLWNLISTHHSNNEDAGTTEAEG
eukprot:PITA_17027